MSSHANVGAFCNFPIVGSITIPEPVLNGYNYGNYVHTLWTCILIVVRIESGGIGWTTSVLACLSLKIKESSSILVLHAQNETAACFSLIIAQLLPGCSSQPITLSSPANPARLLYALL